MRFRSKKQTPVPVRQRPSANNRAVFSYYARGNNTGSQQTTGRHEAADKNIQHGGNRFAWRAVPGYLALVVILGAAVYASTLQANPKISVVSQPGTISRATPEYQKAISTIWERSLFNRSKLTVNSTRIQSEIQSEFNEIASVDIQLPLLGRRPALTLTPGRPAMQLVSINGIFYVDAKGVVLARVAEVSQNKLDSLPLVRDEAELALQPGKPALSETEAIYLQKLTDQLKAESLQVDSITLPRNTANEADVRLAGQQYYLKFSTLVDTRQAVGSYLVVKDKLGRDAVKVGEYIDLRVEEKVFYK